MEQEQQELEIPEEEAENKKCETQTALCWIAMPVTYLLTRKSSQTFPSLSEPATQARQHHHTYMQCLTADWGHTQPSNTLPAASSTSGSQMYFWDEVSLSLSVLNINSRDGYNAFYRYKFNIEAEEGKALVSNLFKRKKGSW